MESRAKSKTGSAIKKLIEISRKNAIVKEQNREIERQIDELKPGDIIVIKPGSKIPADGIITSGASSVNEEMITGESIPVEKIIGSKVIGGTINTSGYFEFEITTISRRWASRSGSTHPSAAMAARRSTTCGVITPPCSSALAPIRSCSSASRARIRPAWCPVSSSCATRTWATLQRSASMSPSSAATVAIDAARSALRLASPSR